MKGQLAVGGTVAILLLAGCSSHASSPSGGTTVSVSTAAATPSPTPTHPTRAQAAAKYLAIVKASNADVDKVNAMDATYNGRSLSAHVSASYRRTAAKTQADLRKAMAQLLTYDWPADVKPTAEKVADSMAGEVTVYGELSKAKTIGDVQDAYDAMLADDNSPAQKIRVQLGLPAVKP